MAYYIPPEDFDEITTLGSEILEVETNTANVGPPDVRPGRLILPGGGRVLPPAPGRIQPPPSPPQDSCKAGCFRFLDCFSAHLLTEHELDIDFEWLKEKIDQLDNFINDDGEIEMSVFPPSDSRLYQRRGAIIPADAETDPDKWSVDSEPQQEQEEDCEETQL